MTIKLVLFCVGLFLFLLSMRKPKRERALPAREQAPKPAAKDDAGTED